MQVLEAIVSRIQKLHKAESSFALVYAHARGAGQCKRDAADRALDATRSREISYERRRELQEIVDDEMRSVGLRVA